MISDSRYKLQVAFPPIGALGQKAIAEARIAIVGCGATGSHSADLLARAGVGHITLIDPDRLELTNLHRSLYDEADVGFPKVFALARHLQAVNQEIKVVPIVGLLLDYTSNPYFQNVQIVVDGVDSVPARLAIQRSGIPWVYAGIAGETGQVMLFGPPKQGPCLTCLLGTHSPEKPPRTGVIGPIAAAVAAVQVGMVLRYLVEPETAVAGLLGRLLRLSVWGWATSITEVPRDPQCPDCGPVDASAGAS